MIKRLIRRVLGLPSEVRVPRGQHDLTRDAISPATAKVCAALREAGFSGYVVGDPQTRYREDPIRMLRGVRLAAKLGLTLDPATRQPIRALAPLLERVPP